MYREEQEGLYVLFDFKNFEDLHWTIRSIFHISMSENSSQRTSEVCWQGEYWVTGVESVSRYIDRLSLRSFI